jgi:glycosyltransferase involved in cell wall biosynthesis
MRTPFGMNAADLKPLVCFLTTGLSRSAGGPFFSVSGLAKAVNAGSLAEATVVGCYRNSQQWPSDARQWEGAAVKAGACRGVLSSLDLCREASATLSHDPQRQSAVHLHGLWDAASVAARMLLRRHSAPLVVSPRGMLEPWALKQSRMKKKVAWVAWQRHVMLRAELLHATSREEYIHFRELGLRAPVAVIPNGLELPVALAEWSKLARRASGPKRCLFLSRMHPKKGLPMLLQAWAALKPAGWQLLIAGDGDARYVQEMKNLARAFDIDAHFVGELSGDAKWQFLASGSLFVLPTYSENFGIAVAEAMAVGLPVITTTGAPWSVLASRAMGWWVAPQVEALRQALGDALYQPDGHLAAMGAQAKAYACSEFGWPAIGERMARCYRWLCSGAECPADVLMN